jgi:hypothetical protein
LFRIREVVASSEPRGNLESVGIGTAEVYPHIDDKCPQCGVRENFIQGGPGELSSQSQNPPASNNRRRI